MSAQHTQSPDWYERRNELAPGQVFRCQGGIVKLDGRVEGDGTKWEVLDWYDGCWFTQGTEIEPGDLQGDPIADDHAAIAKASEAAS